ncbi:MAG: YidB family protein [Brevundimonas sp.]|uniref:YidB family protein n=1 Tax=Brevundimonas sp. TaxID=1871086 RepID=UPI0028D7344D|nr:YidB family protein [uncultured Brevundimonas sp.]
MGFLDNVVKGLGQDAAGGLGDLLKGQGGVGGLAEKFGQAGLGDVIGSWVGNGANAGITPEQITAVIGHGPIADIAAKMGVSPQQAGETLAGLLPEAIDRLTPGGQIDGADDLLSKLPGGVGDMIGGFLKK